jgi:hypothetical protein
MRCYRIEMNKLVIVLAAVPAAVVLAAAAHDDAYDFPYVAMDHPAIEYATRATEDPLVPVCSKKSIPAK